MFTIDTKGILKINQHWMDDNPEMRAYREILEGKVITALGLKGRPKVWGFYKHEWMPYREQLVKAINGVIGNES